MSTESVEKRITKLEQDHKTLSDQIKDNTKLTLSVKADTSDIVEFFKTVSGAFRVFEKLIVIGKFFTWVGGLGAIVYTYLHTTKSTLLSIFK